MKAEPVQGTMSNQSKPEEEEEESPFPKWGNWKTATLPEDHPAYWTENVQRAVLHLEYTCFQSKMELKQLNNTMRFVEKRAMRENYPADDLARQLSEKGLSTKCAVLCECLEAKASRASIVSLLCCPILTCGYCCSFCEAKHGLYEKEKLKAKEQQTKITSLTKQMDKLEASRSTSSTSTDLKTALLLEAQNLAA